MFQSKISIQKKPLPVLKNYFLSFLKEHNKIYCSALNRPVFLDKQPDAILKRHDAKYRLAAFSASIDILKHSNHFTLWKRESETGFAIYGKSKDNKHVTIHIREEISSKKDRRLFLISVFHK